MRPAIGSAFLGLVLLSGSAFGQSTVDPVGTWLTEDGRAKIRIEHCGDSNEKICGFVVWMKDPLNDKGQPRADPQNPDPAKRSRPSMGMELMAGLKPDEDAHYVGEIYNAENGKMYNVTVAAETAEALHVKGCMLRFLCGSQTWARVADIALPTTKVSATTPVAKPVKPASATHPKDTAPTPVH